MKLAASILVLSLAAASLPAAAQEQADPIGSILAQPPGKAAQTADEPDTAAAPSTAVDPDPQIAAPAAGARPAGPAPRLSAPVQLEETGKNPDTPTVRDLAYDSRIRASFASAQSFQGPLDGAWTLSAGGGDRYAFKLSDRGRGEVEGAWRDLRKKGALDGSGFIDSVERTDADVVLRFTGASGPVTVTLEPAGSGWRGQLQEGAASEAASLRREAAP